MITFPTHKENQEIEKLFIDLMGPDLKNKGLFIQNLIKTESYKEIIKYFNEKKSYFEFLLKMKQQGLEDLKKWLQTLNQKNDFVIGMTKDLQWKLESEITNVKNLLIYESFPGEENFFQDFASISPFMNKFGMGFDLRSWEKKQDGSFHWIKEFGWYTGEYQLMPTFVYNFSEIQANYDELDPVDINFLPFINLCPFGFVMTLDEFPAFTKKFSHVRYETHNSYFFDFFAAPPKFTLSSDTLYRTVVYRHSKLDFLNIDFNYYRGHSQTLEEQGIKVEFTNFKMFHDFIRSLLQ